MKQIRCEMSIHDILEYRRLPELQSRRIVTGTTGFIQRRHRRLLARFEVNDEVVSDFGMADANNDTHGT